MIKKFLLLYLLAIAEITAVHFESLIDLTIKVEDANFNLKVKSVKFNGEDLTLDEPNILRPRKEAQYRLLPGRYMLSWSTEKVVARFAFDPLEKDHERIVVLESGDTKIKINIRGDDISLN